FPEPAEGPRRAFLVGPMDGGIIRLRVGDKLVYVPTGEQHGAPAARVVALVIADLVADEILPAAARVSGDVTRAMTDGPRSPAPMRLTLGAVLSKGLGGEEMPCYGVEADLVGRAIGRMTWGAALGLMVIPHQDTPQPDGFSYKAGIARLLVAWRLSRLELLAGPFASRYALGGSSHHVGTLAGAGVSARLAPALSRGLRLVAGVRVEGYANRIHATWSSHSGFATPRVAAAVSIGVAWELGSSAARPSSAWARAISRAPACPLSAAGTHVRSTTRRCWHCWPPKPPIVPARARCWRSTWSATRAARSRPTPGPA
ncbi:MAG TPA: hypothetical protein VFH68_16120, partial [Polyangia bacterium]|nr:hypothetical protein [Polyangia bacterium]